MTKESIKRIKNIVIGILIIALCLVLTARYVKFLPVFMKLIAFAADVLAAYWAITHFLTSKTKNQDEKDR